MLKALVRWLWPPEAEKTQRRRAPSYVTHEELEEALEKASKESQYEINEWYEKFNALHLRLSKRAARAARSEQQPDNGVGQEERPTVLSLRRLGSI